MKWLVTYATTVAAWYFFGPLAAAVIWLAVMASLNMIKMEED